MADSVDLDEIAECLDDQNDTLDLNEIIECLENSDDDPIEDCWFIF